MFLPVRTQSPVGLGSAQRPNGERAIEETPGAAPQMLTFGFFASSGTPSRNHFLTLRL